MNIRFNKSIFFLLAFPSLFGEVNANVIMATEGGIKDEYIVVMKEKKVKRTGGMRNRKLEDFSLQAAESIASSVPNVQLMSTYSTSIRGFSAKMSRTAAEEMAKRKDVAFVEQNSIVKTSAITWGIDRVDQRDLPLDDSYSPSGNGSGVTAYIIDTGIRVSHEDFGGRATWGINTSGDGQDQDCNGHGTHVAGTVGGTTYGVAKEANLVAVKVLQCSGSGSTAGVINGVEWVMNDAAGKKATANLSLGGGASSAMDTAVKNLHNSGVPTVVAAGNSNTDACSASPAREPAVITVGSTTSSDARSGFSNYGSCLDIFAPGSSITAAWIGSDTDYNTISGTSMASPHVCGGAALLLSNGISAENVASELQSRATNDKVTSAGSQSPNKFLYVAETGPTNAPTPAPPTPAPTPCIRDSLKVLITTDNYPLETSWKLTNNCNGAEELSKSAGSYTSQNTEYKTEECVPAAEYTFEISDSYGDGICCGYGSGSYSVEYKGNEVASGGQFGQSQSTTFGTCEADPTSAPINPTPAPVDPTPAPINPTPGPSDPPVASPAASPVVSPTDDWVTIIESNNFELDQGVFNGNNKRIEGISTSSGAFSLRIRNKSKLNTKPVENIEGFVELSVSFMYQARNMEIGEGFVLKAKFNGESSWTEYGRWVKGDDFENSFEEWNDESVNIGIPSGGKKLVRIRFRGHSNQKNDHIYIDDFALYGR